MAEKKSNHRNPKKAMVRQFERAFDLSLLNYKQRIKPIKPKAMMTGIMVASILYFIIFGIAYYGVHNNIMPLDGFAKLVWIIMLPITVIGLFAWQLAKNRLEYPIRQDILKYVEQLETPGGLLWRFSPIIASTDPNDYDSKKIFKLSQDGKIKELAVEDYTSVVEKINETLKNIQNKNFPQDIATEVLENMNDKSFSSS